MSLSGSYLWGLNMCVWREEGRKEQTRYLVGHVYRTGGYGPDVGCMTQAQGTGNMKRDKGQG